MMFQILNLIVILGVQFTLNRDLIFTFLADFDSDFLLTSSFTSFHQFWVAYPPNWCVVWAYPEEARTGGGGEVCREISS